MTTRHYVGAPGVVYLIHLDDPLHPAGGGRHYIGWTGAAEQGERIDRHRRGQGARMLAVALARGIEWRVVASWPGTRLDERRAKRRHQHARLCPVCRPAALARHAAGERRRRAERGRAAAEAAAVAS